MASPWKDFDHFGALGQSKALHHNFMISRSEVLNACKMARAKQSRLTINTKVRAAVFQSDTEASGGVEDGFQAFERRSSSPWKQVLMQGWRGARVGLMKPNECLFSTS